MNGLNQGDDRDIGGALPPELPTVGEMPYESFLAERQRIVDARQRAQQRFDQILTTGAAGALVLSITFIGSIAPNPASETKLLLLAGWGALLVSLAANFVSHLFNQRAFDHYLEQFDMAYLERVPCEHESTASSASRWSAAVSAFAFGLGVFFLAWFTIVNLPFTTTTPG